MADPFPSDGFRHYPGLLDRTAQQALAAAVLALLDEAPAYHATMPKSGRPMSVAMSNAGRFGWYSDRDGGRSEEHTSELQSLMRISYAGFCLNKKKNNNRTHT